jgi:hypothetical protein
MPNYAQSFAFTTTLQSLTKDRVVTDYVVETFFDSAKVWQYLRSKGMYEVGEGGLALTWPVNTTSSPNTMAFVGDQNLPIASMDNNIIRAALDPKYYADALVIKLTDAALNNGSPDAVSNYVKTQLDIVKMSIVNLIAGDLVNNAQSINPLGVNGLVESVDNGTGKGPTYANVSRTAYPTFQGKVNYASAVATEVQDLQTLFLAAQIDNDRPDFYTLNRKAFQSFWNTLQLKDQYIQPDLARTFGGLDLLYQGNPMFMDSHVPTGAPAPSGGGSGGTVYALNSNYLKLYCLDGWDFALQDWRVAEQNATVFTRIYWGGNLINLSPRMHAQQWISTL